MKLKEYKKEYHYFSGKLSDITRKLSFAGIAAVWIFKKDGVDGTISLSKSLKLCLLFFIISLALDLLQYSYQSALWGIFHRYHEKKLGDENAEVTASKYYNWIALLFFWDKVGAAAIGYIILIRFMIQNL